MTTPFSFASLKARLGSHGFLLKETVLSFSRNDGFRQASSLAYATTLALIPALLLLTYALTVGIGSSQLAMEKTADFLSNVMPDFGDVLLEEVVTVSEHKRVAGVVNILVLLWALTPLVGNLRSIVNQIFREKPTRPFWLTKLMDVGMSALFIVGIALVTCIDLVFSAFYKKLPFSIPPFLGWVIPFVLTTLLLLGAYRVFCPPIRYRYLLVGALTTTCLWFVLRPSFRLFLTYDHNYGMTFGSFKAIFIIIIWIYYTMAVLVFGVELIAALRRGEATFIRRMMTGRLLDGQANHPSVVHYPAKAFFFRENESSTEMYHILKGSVSIQRNGIEIARLKEGAFFGEMSHLLGAKRSADAVALEDCQCLVIHERNVRTLMQEYPDIIHEMLVEMARRLRNMNEKLMSK